MWKSVGSGTGGGDSAVHFSALYFPETNVRILCREILLIPLPECRIRNCPQRMASQRIMAPAMSFWDNPFGKNAPSTSRVRIRAVVLLVKIVRFIFLILSF